MLQWPRYPARCDIWYKGGVERKEVFLKFSLSNWYQKAAVYWQEAGRPLMKSISRVESPDFLRPSFISTYASIYVKYFCWRFRKVFQLLERYLVGKKIKLFRIRRKMRSSYQFSEYPWHIQHESVNIVKRIFDAGSDNTTGWRGGHHMIHSYVWGHFLPIGAKPRIAKNIEIIAMLDKHLLSFKDSAFESEKTDEMLFSCYIFQKNISFYWEFSCQNWQILIHFNFH